MLLGCSTSAAVDAMLARLLDDPFRGPRRVVQVFVEARGAAGERRNRIVETVADIAVGTEGQIHRPDEDGAVRRLEGRVEIGVVPETRAHPHEPALSPGQAAMPASTRCLHLVVKRSACAIAHSVPRTHCVAITLVICSVMRTGVSERAAIELAHGVEYFLLPVDRSSRSRSASRSSRRSLIASSRSTSRSSVDGDEIEPMRLDQLAPAMRLSSHQRGGSSLAPG